MILFFAGPQNFVISFMDKPPTLILMRWIFGPLGRGNSTPLSGYVYHKFCKISDWDHQTLQFSRVKEGQSRHKIAPWANKQPNHSFSSQQLYENYDLNEQHFLFTIEIFSNIFLLSYILFILLSLCYYFEHRPWIVWPFFTNLYKLYFSLITVIILCQVDKFRKSNMAMAWVKKTRLHRVSNGELQCSHWNIRP